MQGFLAAGLMPLTLVEWPLLTLLLSYAWVLFALYTASWVSTTYPSSTVEPSNFTLVRCCQ